MNAPIPIFPKGGFKVREQKPVGYAKNHDEALAIVLNMGRNLYGSANGHAWENVYTGVELLADDRGRYYVAIRQIREI